MRTIAILRLLSLLMAAICFGLPEYATAKSCVAHSRFVLGIGVPGFRAQVESVGRRIHTLIWFRNKAAWSTGISGLHHGTLLYYQLDGLPAVYLGAGNDTSVIDLYTGTVAVGIHEVLLRYIVDGTTTNWALYCPRVG